jgi:hypothetical protein
MVANDPGPFPQDALEANRGGRLTEPQRRNLRGQSRGFRRAELQFAALSAVIGLLVWFAEGPAKYATIKPIVGIAFLIVAGLLVVGSFVGVDSLTWDLRDGRVESVEGAITKTRVSGRETSSYYFHVAGTRVTVSRFAYGAAPDAGMVKVYYLPHSHHLVNMERLADTGLPADAMKSPQAMLGLLAEAAHSGNQIQSAEARAHLATMGDAVKAAMTTGATPPDAARDPRPLAQAILGTWSNAMMSVSFAPDGTLSATMPGMLGGRSRSGHWSVDSSGQLVSDVVAGRPMPTEAWVSGDQLTVSMGERGLTFQRVAT